MRRPREPRDVAKPAGVEAPKRKMTAAKRAYRRKGKRLMSWCTNFKADDERCGDDGFLRATGRISAQRALAATAPCFVHIERALDIDGGRPMILARGDDASGAPWPPTLTQFIATDGAVPMIAMFLATFFGLISRHDDIMGSAKRAGDTFSLDATFLWREDDARLSFIFVNTTMTVKKHARCRSMRILARLAFMK